MTAAVGADQLERFRGLIGRSLGLQFEDGRMNVLADVLRRRMDAAGLDADVYLARLEAATPASEVRALAQELTVSETYFFRNVEQYRAFADVALPDRLRHAQAADRRVQILSAGCASGEEPYSVAMVVRGSAAGRPEEVSILGVDVNPLALDKAARARFSVWALRETPPDLQQRWFWSDGREFVLADEVRSSVTFEHGNLADAAADLWRPESLDVVFCRNVLMYFTPESAQGLIGRITRALCPGGYLFLGHAETLRGLSHDFHLRHTHGTFYYQRRDVVARPQRAAVADAPAVLASPAMLADLVRGSDTWVEAIHRASQRIESLVGSAPGSSPTAAAAALAKPVWEIGLVLELLRQERFTAALELVEAFPPEWGRDTEVLLLQAVLLTHSGQFAKAAHACEQLLDIDELNAGAHYLLALCCEGTGDPQGSCQHDRIAIYVDPGFAMAHLHLGLVARRAGDTATARRELRQAMVLLAQEDAARLLLFGGGFGREALAALCRAELHACGGQP